MGMATAAGISRFKAGIIKQPAIVDETQLLVRVLELKGLKSPAGYRVS